MMPGLAAGGFSKSYSVISRPVCESSSVCCSNQDFFSSRQLHRICPLVAAANGVMQKGQIIRLASDRPILTSAVASETAVQESEEAAIDKGIKWGQLTLQGPRPEMEDDIVLEGPYIQGFTYAAVFDGHAGVSSVTFLKKELFKECMMALQGGFLLESRDLPMIENALSQAFLQVDQKLLGWLEESGIDKESGATATILFLFPDWLVVAHVGDSRGVLCRGGKAEELTNDHRPFGRSKVAVAEAKRIREAGGWVTNGRVCGSLSVSRAFGDIPFKTMRNEMLNEGVRERRWTDRFVSKVNISGEWVTANPDVRSILVDDDTEFIILASDGLWDTITSAEAVTFVRNQLKEHGNIQHACEALAESALARNGEDNISIIIADFGKVKQEENFTEEQDLQLGVKQVLITTGMLALTTYLSHLASFN